MSESTSKAWRLTLQTLIAAGALGLAGCNSSGGNTDASNDGGGPSGDGTGGPSPITPVANHRIDLLSARSVGAKVCYDVNRNQRCDAVEPYSLGDAQGQFELASDKARGPLLAELAADQNGTVVRLFADETSPTVSALTTVLHWQVERNPGQSRDASAAALRQLLELEDLDSSAPEAPADNGGTDTDGEDTGVDSDDGDNAGDGDSHDPQTLARDSIEGLIAKYTAQAQADALDAGLDPGLDSNQTLLGRLVAEQSLAQLEPLAEALQDDAPGDAESIVAALPAAAWPGGDIAVALRSVAGDLPTEADPIALLEAGLFALATTCEEPRDNCPLLRTGYTLEGSTLNPGQTWLFRDGREEPVPSPSYEVHNYVLHEDGQWRTLDTSGWAEVARAGDFLAELRDGNGDRYHLRATARELGDTPVRPVLEQHRLSGDDTARALENFLTGSRQASLSREQLNDRHELLFQPSVISQQHAAAEQALAQAETDLAQLQASLASARDGAAEAEADREHASEQVAEAEAEVAALEAAHLSIEEALQQAQAELALLEAEAQAIEDSIALVEAYESVLADAAEQLSEAEQSARDSAAALTEAQAAREQAATALEQAEQALTELLEDEEPGADTGAETDAASDTDDDGQRQAAIAAAEAAKRQAERELVLAETDLSDAEQAAEEASQRAAQAQSEHEAAERSLAEAIDAQLSEDRIEARLQAALDQVNADDSNLQLIGQQLAEASAAAVEAAALAKQHDADASTAQRTLEQLQRQVANAEAKLSAAHVAAAEAPMPSDASCEIALPAQSADNFNCAVVVRTIGEAPAATVTRLEELTATSSTLTLSGVHPRYAVDMLPAGGADSGDLLWRHRGDELNADLPRSRWQLREVHGVRLIAVEVPATLRGAGEPRELLMVEQDGYVRPGLIAGAGAQQRLELFNREALDSILPR